MVRRLMMFYGAALAASGGTAWTIFFGMQSLLIPAAVGFVALSLLAFGFLAYLHGGSAEESGTAAKAGHLRALSLAWLAALALGAFVFFLTAEIGGEFDLLDASLVFLLAFCAIAFPLWTPFHPAYRQRRKLHPISMWTCHAVYLAAAVCTGAAFVATAKDYLAEPCVLPEIGAEGFLYFQPEGTCKAISDSAQLEHERMLNEMGRSTWVLYAAYCLDARERYARNATELNREDVEEYCIKGPPYADEKCNDARRDYARFIKPPDAAPSPAPPELKAIYKERMQIWCKRR